jgi:hypothetical protein
VPQPRAQGPQQRHRAAEVDPDLVPVPGSPVRGLGWRRVGQVDEVLGVPRGAGDPACRPCSPPLLLGDEPDGAGADQAADRLPPSRVRADDGDLAPGGQQTGDDVRAEKSRAAGHEDRAAREVGLWTAHQFCTRS